MNRKHVPPEPASSHGARRVLPPDLEAGRSYLAVARPLFPGHRARPAGTPTIPAVERRVRGPPVPEMDRADGWLHRLRSPSTQPVIRNYIRGKDLTCNSPTL